MSLTKVTQHDRHMYATEEIRSYICDCGPAETIGLDWTMTCILLARSKAPRTTMMSDKCCSSLGWWLTVAMAEAETEAWEQAVAAAVAPACNNQHFRWILHKMGCKPSSSWIVHQQHTLRFLTITDALQKRRIVMPDKRQSCESVNQ